MGKAPLPTDVLVGTRIRGRRTTLGMSQEKLAAIVGISFQQVQKYEKGVNRVGAGRLQAVAGALGVPISYFFDEEPARDDGSSVLALRLVREPGALRLLQAYSRLAPALRNIVLDLACGLARIGSSDASAAEDQAAISW